MADLLTTMLDSDLGRRLTGAVGVPHGATLRRHAPGQPLVPGPVLVTATPGGRQRGRVVDLLAAWGAPAHDLGELAAGEVDLVPAVDEVLGSANADDAERIGALVLDVTGLADAAGSDAVHAVLHATVTRMARSGRVVVLVGSPDLTDDPRVAAARAGVVAVVRTLAKELRGGATANALVLDDDVDAALAGPLRFLLSARSAYVDGQPLPVREASSPPPQDWDRPLVGRTALVTGASRGIGAAIAGVLARDGAHVHVLDLPSQGEALATVANEVGGTAVQLDITAERAPGRLAGLLAERGGVDLVVHNAGITRDRTIARMEPARWRQVVDVNLTAAERIDDALLAGDVVHEGGALVGVASTSGIAGNRGQANYAMSKAGVIGRARALAPALAGRGITSNAVAPGFILTEMTDAMPVATREVAKRLNSLDQGGLPVDVAEAVGFLGWTASAGVTGQLLRVCGQSLVGA